MDYYKKIAKILRTDIDNVYNIEKVLGEKTGIDGIINKIGEENDKKIDIALRSMGLSRMSSAKVISDHLIKKIGEDDKKISKYLEYPECNTQAGCKKIINFLTSLGDERGFFIKHSKFIEIIKAEPPQKIISTLGYEDVDGLIKNENLYEIAAALRFIEGGDWINKHFLPHYKELTPNDFEERNIKMISINEKWRNAAKAFIKKKYHNISHLKELGFIFIIPTDLNLEGEIIRTIGLLRHYWHEVRFYSDLFKEATRNKKEFSDVLMKLLRGDVIDDRKMLKDGDWMIVQRYLAKIDEFDWRLAYPHTNPEAIHWEKAEKDIAELGLRYNIGSLMFWKGLNWVGDYFSTDIGIDMLVSFNIVDNAMSLVKEREMIKYLYHHQEALWNKIFASYFGDKKMEEIIKENIIKGIIKFS